jgi:hypothetical protein
MDPLDEQHARNVQAGKAGRILGLPCSSQYSVAADNYLL